MVERATKVEQQLPVTSSVPDELPVAQQTLFQEVLRLLHDQQVPFAVSGAAALQEYTGICRSTKDLDVFLTAADASQALQSLLQHGFETEVRDPVWLAKVHRDGYFVDLITGMSNGVMTVDATWIERAHWATVFGVRSRVLAPEELLASKLFVARRERFDGADIAHIVYASRGELDWKRVLELVGEHWEVLLWALVLFRYVYPGASANVPPWLWDDLLGRFSRAVNFPDPNASFRGSLIDDKMFAIDLREWGLDNLLEARLPLVPKISDPGEDHGA